MKKKALSQIILEMSIKGKISIFETQYMNIKTYTTMKKNN